jgi:hypothetical protein
MYLFRKEWKDGGSLTVTYEGRSDGDATFASEVNEGLDREMSVTFKDFSGDISVECRVRQEGRREILYATDGALYANDGTTINVIKE